MKKTAFLLLCSIGLFSSNVRAERANYNIIPQPKSVQADTTQTFTLQDGMGIAYDAADPEIARNAQFLQKWVEQATGIRLALTPNDKRAAIRLTIGLQSDKKQKKGKQAITLTEQQQEAYVITVDKSGISIQARQPIGLFRAAQTLRKSLPLNTQSPISLPFVTIQDEPRFAYRGVLLDCARHFFSVDVIKQFLDAMALHGCNQFH